MRVSTAAAKGSQAVTNIPVLASVYALVRSRYSFRIGGRSASFKAPAWAFQRGSAALRNPVPRFAVPTFRQAEPSSFLVFPRVSALQASAGTASLSLVSALRRAPVPPYVFGVGASGERRYKITRLYSTKTVVFCDHNLQKQGFSAIIIYKNRFFPLHKLFSKHWSRARPDLVRLWQPVWRFELQVGHSIGKKRAGHGNPARFASETLGGVDGQSCLTDSISLWAVSMRVRNSFL